MSFHDWPRLSLVYMQRLIIARPMFVIAKGYSFPNAKAYSKHKTAWAVTPFISTLSLEPVKYTAFTPVAALRTLAVERALTLWKDGNISIERITESRLPKGSLKLKEIRNKVTGISSTRGLAFSDSNWGNTVRWWLANIQKTEKARPRNLQIILREAQRFEKVLAPQQNSTTAGSSSLPAEERALLPESDEEDDGEGSGRKDNDDQSEDVDAA
ncbi:hypothetical protein AGABI1DRAFT_95970 [Agaricus bisporus var. burnettii JB137-S8]|uniref:Uncharacterized protein n=1 Tax=Agaricus bisporus var. burnettii (strain JB137-S8 / ATCC MYA-4627 / FGSC 10392) TaxID=597362 RepID=K5WTQ2_AGABU|nr:uncharacterized protein AGABI1DRAFT_95970 [Agaricus bisporus var. burnettii JB137-S8]EKM73952.1 hypothetical protein AGABI1DRAFT_95970 [Agaricus bisporus var. burnettii JB137-S8]